MKTTKRFDKAVTKLYNAFNEGSLNAFDCSACAIGSLVGHSQWSGYIPFEVIMDSWGREYHTFTPFWTCVDNYPKHPDYNTGELKHIEYIFLKEWEKKDCLDGKNKEVQFQGLMAVIEYLASLDGIEVPEIVINDFKSVLQ